jgi:hypothetical protein
MLVRHRMVAAATFCGDSAREKGEGMHRVLTTLVALLVTAAVGGSALAAGNAGTTTISTEPVQFTLVGGECSDLPTGLTVEGSGIARTVFHESVDASGQFHTVIETTITGTATDSAGGTYRFNYHNSQSLSPSADFPFVVTIADHFNLVGNGGANQTHTFFVLKVLVTSETTDEILFAHFHGDLACDPL